LKSFFSLFLVFDDLVAVAAFFPFGTGLVVVFLTILLTIFGIIFNNCCMSSTEENMQRKAPVPLIVTGKNKSRVLIFDLKKKQLLF
jgi:hypothetical protein